MYCRAQSCGLLTECRGNKDGFGKVIGWTALRLKVIIMLLLRLAAGKGCAWVLLAYQSNDKICGYPSGFKRS